MKERIQGLGGEIVANRPEEFDAFIKAGVVKWSKVVRDAGIKPE